MFLKVFVTPRTVATVGLVVLGSSCAPDERPTDARLETARQACTFVRGSMPSESIGREYPIGDQIPIDHFIVVMLENRSFDHYFGTMPGVDGIPANVVNLDSGGTPYSPYLETAYCIDDVHHSWDAAHEQYADGANSGFVTSNDPGGRRALGHYDEGMIPFYRQLYSTFAMSDRHFCSALGPTWVNRWFSMSATSFGRTSNDPLPRGVYQEYNDEPYLIYELLEQGGVSWRVFYSDAPFAVGAFTQYTFDHLTTDNFKYMQDFYTSLGDGTLPQVSFVEPAYAAGVDNSDEHPPASPQPGQVFVAQVVDAVMKSPYWPRTAIVLTYDEHGGYYDHVPPPSACTPDDRPPIRADGSPAPYAFDRLGFRVPLVVISPFSKPGYVSHHVTDHTSLLRLLEARFELPALTRRDANAWPLLDMFDFENPPFLTPPSLLTPTIDQAPLDACRVQYPPPIP